MNFAKEMGKESAIKLARMFLGLITLLMLAVYFFMSGLILLILHLVGQKEILGQLQFDLMTGIFSSFILLALAIFYFILVRDFKHEVEVQTEPEQPSVLQDLEGLVTSAVGLWSHYKKHKHLSQVPPQAQYQAPYPPEATGAMGLE